LFHQQREYTGSLVRNKAISQGIEIGQHGGHFVLVDQFAIEHGQFVVDRGLSLLSVANTLLGVSKACVAGP
jgi:hypothetical protein